MKRTRQRIGVLCFIVALSVLLFYIGREHQVFLDNRTIEVEGDSFRALKFVRVTVNDLPSIELMPRDRDLVAVVGPSFRLKVEIMDAFGTKAERVIEKNLSPGFTKDLMLSLPLLASDRDDYILPPPRSQTPPPEPKEPTENTTEEDALIPQ
ncbi:MAG: hypothetical protein LBO68_00870 [Synergistaceae bacterium]|jgi:hypothetical protein|nr:hypothetical protein [Synergistaceae bacterium]